MATTVVGLFDSQGDSTAALNDLAANGFGRSEVDQFDRSSVNLATTLQQHGLPARDAQMFAMGVEQAGDYLLVATTEDSRADLARDLMNRHGALDINDAHRVRGFAAVHHTQTHTQHSVGSAAVGAGATGTALGAAHLAPHNPPATATTISTTAHTHAPTLSNNQTVETGDRIAVPIVEEQLVVGKRQIERGGAVIHTRVIETPVSEQVTLREEHVHVERHPVNRPVTNTDTAFREATINVTEKAEEAVVGKTARVVEEVVIGKEATQHTETVRDTVRRTDVYIDEANNDTLRTPARETTRTV
jgi:uncharacterized protein (TIGR02271 family)